MKMQRASLTDSTRAVQRGAIGDVCRGDGGSGFNSALYVLEITLEELRGF
jgi:hypothetical protein